MTELYRLFESKEYPTHWPEEYRQKAHYSLGLFLAQYLCNGFNLADAGRLTYDAYYYQNQAKPFDSTVRKQQVEARMVLRLLFLLLSH